jgi:hypothetical protein
MRRANKTLRRKLQRRQRTRNARRYRKRQTRRRQTGGGLPVPEGALVAVSTGGEYGVPILLPVRKYEEAKEGLED